MEVESFRFYLSKLGIEEKLPKSNSQMDYTVLRGPAIRIFNRILKYMEDHGVSPVEKLLQNEDITETYEVISKDKVHNIEVVNTIQFRDFLRKIGIINFGEELDEEFCDFIVINEEFDHLIMMKKLKKALKDIKNSEYFSYFGTKKRMEIELNTKKKKTSRIMRSLSRPDQEKNLNKSLSLKSVIEEKINEVKIEEIENGDLLNLENFDLTHKKCICSNRMNKNSQNFHSLNKSNKCLH